VLATDNANFRAKSKARVIEIVSAAEGGRARHPRHELGDRILQSRDPIGAASWCGGRPAAVVELHQIHTEEARARTVAEAEAAGVDPRIVRVR
jgi:hypothetical protein